MLHNLAHDRGASCTRAEKCIAWQVPLSVLLSDSMQTRSNFQPHALLEQPLVDRERGRRILIPNA